MNELARAVDVVIRDCLAVRGGETVLVIADDRTRRLGEALRDGAAAAGGDAVLAMMDERAEHGSEPPAPLAAAMAACEVFIAPTVKSLSHTRARNAASDAGARGATMPGVTEDMLARVMRADFALMAARSRAVAGLLTSSGVAHVSCPRGSDLKLDLSDRTGIPDDGDLRAPGAFGNLPCGEGFIAPRGGEGTLVASSLAGFGLSEPPTRLTVSGGSLARAEGGFGRQLYEALLAPGEDGLNLAELGVGTNDAAILTGEVLEDEKLLGSVHIAFGASAGIGGEISVPVHLDVVVTEASLTIGDTLVLDRGRFVLEV